MDNGALRFTLIGSYSKSSGRQCGRSNPQTMAIWHSYWEIPTLRAQADHLTTQAEQVADLPHRKWQFQIHTDRTLRAQADQVADQVPDLTPQTMAIWDSYSYIASLRAQADRVADLSPPREWKFEIHIDRFLLSELRQTRWQTKWQIYPQGNGNFRFLLTDSYSESSGRSSTRSLPPENGNLRFILIDSYSESSGRRGGRPSGRSIPQEMEISDSYWQIPTLRALADQVPDQSPQKMAIWDSYS